MLCVNNYTREYIDECRSNVDVHLVAYQNLVAAARDRAGNTTPFVDAAVEAFEPTFYNNMVLLLDNYFCHRSRTIEKKDGNPLNEVRVMCNSMMLTRAS
jgi:hypothetical protein